VKNIAYLNNHNTAAAWVIRLFTQLGAGVYIPAICAEVGSLSGTEAKSARTAILDPQTEALLDEIDVYAGELTVTSRHVQALDRTFEAVVFPGAVRTPNLLFLAEHCRIPVIVYEWGDVGNIVFHSEYASVIAARSNVQVAVAYEAFSDTALHLPLGLPKDLFAEDYERILFDRPTFALVASRIYSQSSYTRDNVLDFVRDVDGSDYDLLIVGKDHRDPELRRAFGAGWHDVQVRSDLSRESLCSVLSSVDGLLYWMREPAVVQLSPFESASLGTPIIYSSDTFLSSLLPGDDPCRATSPAEIRRAMELCADPVHGAALASQQWGALRALMDDAAEKWSSVLQPRKKARVKLPFRR
jgi:hypothetical protein